MRKTKIVCTIGPASSSEEVFADMCKAGLNVARLNFSHGTHEEHQQKFDMIRKVRKKLDLPVAIMLDTKGPEYRIRTFKNKKIMLKDGDLFTFTTRQIDGDETIVSVSYAGLAHDLSVGDTVLVNNGLVIFEVEKIEGTEIHCRVVTGGELSDCKSMSFPHKVLDQVYLSEQDKDDLLFGIQNGIDFVAASFVSRKQDVLDVRRFLDEHGGKDVEIIAKIENQTGIDNVEEICQECSGIMIGRGDLGVEVPFAELPAIQKYLITKCRLLGKRVITATEMLESMIHNPRPTRAEISDVANAVYDGTSAVMLSGESAAGKYPVKTVQTMAEIVEETEKHIDYEPLFRSEAFQIKKYGRCDFSRNVLHGLRYPCKGYRRQFAFRRDCTDGFALPCTCRYHRHGDKRSRCGTVWRFHGACSRSCVRKRLHRQMFCSTMHCARQKRLCT